MMRETLSAGASQLLIMFSCQKFAIAKKASTCAMDVCDEVALTRTGGAVRCNHPNCLTQRRGPSVDVHVDACC